MEPAPEPLRLVVRAGHPDFLDLPWSQPLAEWDTARLVRMAHGISRHVVRFVRYGEAVYALKETGPREAAHEYRALRLLVEDRLPAVEAIGVATGSAGGRAATLITRYLDFSLPYWYLLARDEGPDITSRLLDAGVVLLVRLHLSGVFWGDCSLSNVLFRRDAGALMAYLVDAETTEKQPTISDGLRRRDLEIAWENVAGGLLDLQAAGRVSPDIDPAEVADALLVRYDQLWNELTRTEELEDAARWRIDGRIRDLNDLGFDVEELAIEPTPTGAGLRIRPVLVEEGHHSRELQSRTGLAVQENQARRLLADIASYGARLEQDEGRPVPTAVAAARWLDEVYEPIVAAIPDELHGRLDDAEFFHQLLEHRYLMSERAQHEVSNQEALEDYIAEILARRPSERNLVQSTGQVPVITPLTTADGGTTG